MAIFNCLSRCIYLRYCSFNYLKPSGCIFVFCKCYAIFVFRSTSDAMHFLWLFSMIGVVVCQKGKLQIHFSNPSYLDRH